ncbi:hypothetical protein KY348_00020 [Candidatus Woesearchaeota archaeon]|nr:hypothetical protein [Candidatus Woesearchaeota archaeon]
MNNEMFSLDKERAEQVFKRLVKAYENKEKIFSWPDVFPEQRFTRLYDPSSLEFRLILFFTVNFDRNQQSSPYYRKVAESIEKKKFRNPQEILDYDIEKIKRLREIWGIPFKKTAPYVMHKNIQLLKEKYNGDPLNVIKDEQDVNKARKNLEVFKGYGPHLSALLMTFYLKYGVISFDNQKKLEVKIDTNKLRVMYDNSIINPGEEHRWGDIHKDKILPAARKFLCDVCEEHDLDTNIVSEAMWPIGERISRQYKHHLGKRKLNYIMNSPLLEFTDYTQYLDIPYGKNTVAKLKKRGFDVKGSYCYFQKLDSDQKLLI